MHFHDFTEADLALVHALQIHPRARWADLAPVLGSTPATLARRWGALRADGLAWITAYPSPSDPTRAADALVELDCTPADLDAVIARLEPEPGVVSIEHAASGPTLILTVAAESFEALSSLVLDRLSRTPGVHATRTRVTTRVHVEGSRWRLDALDTGQRDAVLALAAQDPPRGDSINPTSAVFAPLVRALTADGRASAADLAERTGRPAATVRRQLAALLRSGRVSFRCDVAQSLTRWPVNATWWCRIGAADLDRAVAYVRSDPHVRLCMSLTGPANFAVNAWTASLPDLLHLQTRLESALPPGSVLDLTVGLRTRKRMGWLLHPDGRATGEVVPLALGG